MYFSIMAWNINKPRIVFSRWGCDGIGCMVEVEVYCKCESEQLTVPRLYPDSASVLTRVFPMSRLYLFSQDLSRFPSLSHQLFGSLRASQLHFPKY